MTRVINPAVGCHYFPPGLQLPSQPLRGLLPISLLGAQKHDGCEQFAYPTAMRLRFEPRPYCARVQHANHSATEPPSVVLLYYIIITVLYTGSPECGVLGRLIPVHGATTQLSGAVASSRHGERKCADTVGTVLVLCAGHFQC